MALLMATSCQVLDISKDGHSTSSLGNLLLGLTILIIKKKRSCFLCLSGISHVLVCAHCPLHLFAGSPEEFLAPSSFHPSRCQTQSRSQAGWSHLELRDELGSSEPQGEQGRWWHVCFPYIILLGFMFCFVLVNFSCLCLQKPDCHYWFQRVIWLSAPSACNFLGKNKAAGTSKQNYKWINW